jgi:hypothetical protein
MPDLSRRAAAALAALKKCDPIELTELSIHLRNGPAGLAAQVVLVPAELLKIYPQFLRDARVALERRNRPHDSATVRRNIAICDAHARKEKPATIRELARQHHLSEGAVKEIYRRRKKWWALRGTFP